MSEELKDAIVEERDKQELVSNHDIIDYATWEDAIRGLRSEMIQTFDRGMKALGATLGASLDTKIETIITSKLPTTIVQKMDDDVLPEIQIHGKVKEFKVGPENEQNNQCYQA